MLAPVPALLASLALIPLAAASVAAQDPIFDPDRDLLDPEAPYEPLDGKYGLRFTGEEERLTLNLLSPDALDAIGRGLEWLAAQQSSDGHWAPDDDRKRADCVVPTSLALLAFLADGATTAEGAHIEVVVRGIDWLLSEAEPETGRFGEALVAHVLATFALAEADVFSPDPALQGALEKAVQHLLAVAQEGTYDNDATTTAWAVLALRAALDAGVDIDPERLVATDAWLTSITRGTGAVKRPRGSEANLNRGVAAVLMARVWLGSSPWRVKVLEKQAERLGKRSALPRWPAEADERCDLQYWYWATHATRQFDGARWSTWQSKSTEALVENQNDDGSWNPVGTIDECSGQVHSTSFALLTLEASYRFTVLHTRPEDHLSRARGATAARFEAERDLKSEGGDEHTEQALRDALAWLAAHQSPDGRWDCDGFMKLDPPEQRCDGPGDALHDVGVTGLALLAFLGDGNTMMRGEYRSNVLAGVRWLAGAQDPKKRGLIGHAIGHTFLYDHAIATYALSEALQFNESTILRETTQEAVNYLLSARNPLAAWRYDVPPKGQNDTSITAWAFLALHAADRAGLEVDTSAYEGAMNWIDQVTEENGRVGYNVAGSGSARVTDVNDHYPPDVGEAHTAAGLFMRFVGGERPAEQAVMKKHADLILKRLPDWDAAGLHCDMYYWYYGSLAMFQMGARYWTAWNRAMKSVIIGGQRQDGSHKGSWDPLGPWGHSGGRIYSTALMALSLEVYYRYARGF